MTDPATTQATQAKLETELEAGREIDISVTIPLTTAVALKHRGSGALTINEIASMLVQLYADAPLEPTAGARALTKDQFDRIAEALGSTPQTTEQLAVAVTDLCSMSFAGVRLKLTSEEIDIITSRNASGLPAREWAAIIFRQMFEAWRDGRI